MSPDTIRRLMGRMPKPGAAALVRVMVVLAAPSAALAHAFPQRHEPAVPLGLTVGGAGLAVAASFAIVALVQRGPSEATAADAPRGGAPLLGRLGAGLLGLLLVAGLIGDQGSVERNPLPAFVWVYLWVGLLLASAVLGDLWRHVSPFAFAGHRLFGAGSAPSPTPTAWPALGFFMVFAWGELVWPDSAHPRPIALAILGYAAVTLAGMALVGTRRWLASGEFLAVLFREVGRLAPVQRRGGRLAIGLPGSALVDGPVPTASLMLLILALLATVSFDGFSETLLWSTLAGVGVRALYGAGVVQDIGFTAAGALVRTAGLLGAVALVSALYLGTMRAVARREGAGWLATAQAYAPTLLPIAIGYHAAHYLAYLLLHLQVLPAFASDPLALGWNLFGTAGQAIDPERLDMGLVWAVAVAGVVGGHVIAVLAAHRLALRRSVGRGGAVRAQVPLAGLMTLYTMVSLWIIAQPIVEH